MKAPICVIDNVQLCRDGKFLGRRKLDYTEKIIILNQATIYWLSISLEMSVPSQGHYGFHSFRLLNDFVCLYTYEFWLSLCKIARSSVILLLPLLFTSPWPEIEL
jgi:hypothetical protein